MTHFQIDNKVFAGALKLASSIINQRAAMPMARNILLDRVDDKRWDMVATNADGATLRFCVPLIMVEEEVRRDDRMQRICLTDLQKLQQMTAAIPGDVRLQIFIDRDKKVMRVNYMTGEFEIAVESADEYPTPKSVSEPECSLSVPAQWLLRTVKAARTCVSTVELQPQMESVALDADMEGLTVVGSDGHQLYKNRLEVGLGTGFLTGQPKLMLLHRSILTVLDMAFAVKRKTGADGEQQDDTKLSIVADDQRIVIRSDEGTELSVPMIDARYPNYNSVIPAQQSYRTTVDVDMLLAAMRRVTVMANDASQLVRIEKRDQQLYLRTEDTEFCRRCNDRVPVVGDDTLPEGFKIGVKSSTLMSLLACIGTETCHIEMSEPSRAITIREEDVRSTMVLLAMPMLLEQ